jgi:2-C-methyl-D-erythritol 4-phosphate cytidylyltransferase
VTTDLSAIVPVATTAAENKAAVFMPVAGEAPLACAVRLMLGGVAPGDVVVASARTLVEDVRESLAAHGLSAVGVAVANGSGTRADCVAAGLDRIGGARYVLVHDVRRPLTPAGLRDRVIDGLRGGSPVVMPAQPLTDSVKEVDALGSVIGTLDRSMLLIVQYPRGFVAENLSELLAWRTSDEFDELEEAMAAGMPITVVDGDPNAFVADLPRDTSFVEAIVNCRPAGPDGS